MRIKLSGQNLDRSRRLTLRSLESVLRLGEGRHCRRTRGLSGGDLHLQCQPQTTSDARLISPRLHGTSTAKHALNTDIRTEKSREKNRRKTSQQPPSGEIGHRGAMVGAGDRKRRYLKITGDEGPARGAAAAEAGATTTI